MRIAIRVDASAAIGTGHVWRTLALAQALRELGGEVRFVTRALGVDSAGIIAGKGFATTILLDAPSGDFAPDPAIPHAQWAQVPGERDAAETTAALAGFAPDWVVVDCYAFDAKWHEAVRAALGCRIAVIDDLADRALACDVLIDHNYAADHRAKYAGVLPPGARLLAGPHFALLGPAFAQAPRYEFHEEVRSIGIFMGGVDAGGYSLAVLEALDAIGFAGAVEVVATSANPHLAALHDRVEARANTTLSIDLPDLAGFFARHDLQVGAAGGASWERCCIGAPAMLVVVAANQLEVAMPLAAEGIVELCQDPSPRALAEQIAGLAGDPARRAELAARSRRLVDGLGAHRAALALMAGAMMVRPATMEDARMMFDWRGDPATREVSREAGELVWDDHCAWLERALADPARRLYVGEIAARPVGVIRFDFSEADRAEVSLYLDPALHGLGLGPHLLACGEAAADPAIIDAVVLEGNSASQRLFEASGYERAAPTVWIKRRAHQRGLPPAPSAR